MSCELKCAQNILTEKQMHQVVRKCLGERLANHWQMLACDRRPAGTGLAGFLGDHSRISLHVSVHGLVKEIRLFVKSIPASNAPKAQFIEKNYYFKREVAALRLAEEMHGAEGLYCDQIRGRVRVYFCNDNIVVMPDLTLDGYRTLPNEQTLDLPHALLAAASLARFHAAFANYTTARTVRDKRPYNFLQEHEDIMTEPTFCDSPWLRAAAKLSFNFLKTFSNKFEQYPVNLEHLLVQRYIDACAALMEHEGTLNVVLHKDLWVNNIMFKYEGGAPTNALLIDFQCLRYGPPAFDLMSFLYLTTGRKFRECHQEEIFRRYFAVFSETLDDATQIRLKDLNYDFDAFMGWCERSRMFGMFEALAIFPYVLMDPCVAQQTFDDPDTFLQLCDEDRTTPVLAHCRCSSVYLQRQLEVNEEFVDCYVMKNL